MIGEPGLDGTAGGALRMLMHMAVFVAPFTVTTFGGMASLIVYPLSFYYLSLAFLRGQGSGVGKPCVYFIVLFAAPCVLSLTVGLLSAVVVGSHGIDFLAHPGLYFGRIVNFIGVIVFFLSLAVCVQRGGRVALDRLIFYYWLGLLIVMLTAVWQYISFHYGVVEFPFETRANVHGVSDDLRAEIKFRVTGIAREPSYFAPLAVLFTLMSIHLFEKKVKYLCALLGITLLMLSFSGGGFLSALFVGAAFLVAAFCRGAVSLRSVRNVFIALALLWGLFWTYSEQFALVYDVASQRLVGAASMETSGRAFMSWMPVVRLFQSNVINVLFGHGLKTYSLLGTVYFLPDGTPVHVTSNNIFTDHLWEAGVVGVLSLALMFGYLLGLAYRRYGLGKYHRLVYYLVAAVLSFGLYRGDMFSPSMWFILFICVWVLSSKRSIAVQGLSAGSKRDM